MTFINAYVGVPAPEVLEDDPWFGPAPDTEKSILLKELRAQLQSQIIIEDDVVEIVKEPDNIHEIMYNIATQNVSTTLSLDPFPTFGGGSEEYHNSGWMSGISF